MTMLMHGVKRNADGTYTLTPEAYQMLMDSFEVRVNPRTCVELGAVVHRARTALAMGTAQLACEAGVTEDYVTALEAGHPGNDLITVLKVTDVLGLDPLSVPLGD